MRKVGGWLVRRAKRGRREWRNLCSMCPFERYGLLGGGSFDDDDDDDDAIVIVLVLAKVRCKRVRWSMYKYSGMAL